MDHDHVTLTDWAPQSFAFPWQSLGKEFIHGPVLSDLRDSLSRSVSFRCISCRKNASYCLTMGHVPNKYQKYGQTYPYIQYIYIIIYIYMYICLRILTHCIASQTQILNSGTVPSSMTFFHTRTWSRCTAPINSTGQNSRLLSFRRLSSLPLSSPGPMDLPGEKISKVCLRIKKDR